MAGYELRMVAGCGKEFRDGWLRAENGGWMWQGVLRWLATS
jgi:hypothetical protein